jgi:uncharacterized protein
MLCPHCTSTMREITKSGVLIDLCPDCKGVWLDRGELDKILSRARELGREWEEDEERGERRSRRDDHDDDDDRSYGDSRRSGRKRRWSDIFDIFD